MISISPLVLSKTATIGLILPVYFSSFTAIQCLVSLSKYIFSASFTIFFGNDAEIFLTFALNFK